MSTNIRKISFSKCCESKYKYPVIRHCQTFSTRFHLFSTIYWIPPWFTKSWWCYKLRGTIEIENIKNLSTFSTISGSRNHTISTISGSMNFFCSFLQFLDPETVVFLQFLEPETAPFLRFLDPEFFFVLFYNFWIFVISGSRNCTIYTIFGGPIGRGGISA